MSHSPRKSILQDPGGRLGGLPILAHFFELLRIREIVDSYCPPAPQMKVSHGEAIIALLFCIFQGDHRLYCVNEILAPYDLKVLYGRPEIDSKLFHDTRLGESLDAINEVAKKVLYDISISGLRLYGKPIKAILGDTTTVSVFGEDYEKLVKEETPFVFPIFGFSKDHRPDLRQIVINLMTTVFGFPVDGDILDGNRSDVETFRDNLEAMATMPWVKDNTPMIADSKLATFPTLARASELKIPVITMVPDTMNVRKRLITQISKVEDLPLLRKTESGDVYHGKSVTEPYLIERKDGTPNQTIWLRFLVLHSSQLAATKVENRKRAQEKEERALEKWAGKLAKEEFACQSDARKVQEKEWKLQKTKHHDLTVEIKEIAIPGKRRRGKPAQNDKPIPPKIVWKVACSFNLRPEVASKWDPEGMFVLVTTIIDRRVKDDKEILEAYRSRDAVETSQGKNTYIDISAEKCFYWFRGFVESGFGRQEAYGL